MLVDNLLNTLRKLDLVYDFDQWHVYNTIIWEEYSLTLDDYWSKYMTLSERDITQK